MSALPPQQTVTFRLGDHTATLDYVPELAAIEGEHVRARYFCSACQESLPEEMHMRVWQSRSMASNDPDERIRAVMDELNRHTEQHVQMGNWAIQTHAALAERQANAAPTPTENHAD